MTVDRIGHIEPLQPGKKPGRVESAQNADRFDSINLSPEALAKAEKYQIVELIKASQELDETQIVRLREQINDPSYLNEKVISATADKIVDSWLL
jgi:negative regulator of flagellin synthesis FlgM